MKPGDRVRMLHGKEEGRIIKLLPNNQLEIEIEDGFRIPVLTKEVVVVSKAEEEYLNKGKGSTEIEYEQEKESSGVWLGALAFNDKLYSFHILNDTSYSLMASMLTKNESGVEGQFIGNIDPGKEAKVLELKSDEFSSWPELIFQGIYFKSGKFEYQKPSEIRFKFKADNFFKRKAQLPILHKQGYVFALQVEQEAIKLDALKQAMNENREVFVESVKIPNPGQQVDLHIEKLTNETNLSNNEMLRIQLNTFQSALDAALVNNLAEIVFIHGVGNGVLRNEIHKRLAATKGIKFFEDAAKEKFGYGATKVRLR